MTQWVTELMFVSALGAAALVKAASAAAAPEQYFLPFLLVFLALFVATGVGNGSTFGMIPVIFEPAKAGPVLGRMSAVGAHGSFIVRPQDVRRPDPGRASRVRPVRVRGLLCFVPRGELLVLRQKGCTPPMLSAIDVEVTT